MKFRPPEKHIIVKVAGTQDKTKGGIFIPAGAKLGPMQGPVVAAGANTEYKVGDVVLFLSTAGTLWEFEDVKYVSLPNNSVLAALES